MSQILIDWPTSLGFEIVEFNIFLSLSDTNDDDSNDFPDSSKPTPSHLCVQFCMT